MIEGLGVLGKHHITIVGDGGGSDAGAVAPQQFFFLFGAAVGLLLIGGAFDAQRAVGITDGNARFVVAIGDGGTRIVLLDPGLEVLHVEGDGLAQARDLLDQRADGRSEQTL